MAIDLDYGGARRLVFAVTLKAIGDARAGRAAAAEWLMSDAGDWLEACGLRELTSDDMRAAIEDTTPIDRHNHRA